MIMEMGELQIYRWWTHILEWRYAHDIFNSQIIFEKNSKHKWTHPLTKLNTNMSMWIIFGSSRNVYVVEEPF
jgi:hypothetical protein